MSMRLACALLIVFLGGGRVAPAEWLLTSSEKERSPNELAEHWTTTVEDTASGLRAGLHLVVFDARVATLRVIDQPGPARKDLAAAIARTNAFAGVNGGYFDPAEAPVGLLISDGRVLSPLRKAKLLSGVLFATANRVEILRTSHFSTKEKPPAAVQCGPLLIEHGKIISGLNDSKAAHRTFAAVDGKGRVLLGICSSVSLRQLSQILCLTNIAGSFQSARALNLDGGSSTAFWFAGSHGSVSFAEQKAVRDFVLVVPRLQTKR